ncbi:HupV protein [Rhodobacteraceae bacterium CCMM004]|nr:HupV protein [Rhodobacteraceae bacterium CCMM004]
MPRLVVGPFNRVEGDLEVTLDVEEGRVARARVNSPLFRGFEIMLLGKDPRDALTLTPRICGICSISQSAAAARALADAQGLTPAPEGERVAQLIHGIENVCDHLTHFYLFFMADFARPAYVGRTWHAAVEDRFLATQGSGARAAVAARAQLMHILGLLAGKWPHTLALQPGGVTRAPGPRDKVRIALTLRQFRGFLERELFGAPLESFAELTDPAALMAWETGDAGLFLHAAADLDLDAVGRGPGRYLSYGAYPQAGGPAFAAGLWAEGRRGALDLSEVVEHTAHSWMQGGPRHPADGLTEPDEDMAAPGYSWCKAPRMAGQVVETGAFARQVVDGHPLAVALARAGGGVTSRVAGRLIEIARTQVLLETWCAGIDPDAPFMARGMMPSDGEGVGLVEAARGALGHWLRIEGGRIAGYQIVAPTTWNFSPRDGDGVPGALEAALEGAPVGADEDTPLSVQHIVRSFDPCMVCTVH